MKAKKALKRLNEAEALLENVLDGYDGMDTALRGLLDNAKSTVGRAKDALNRKPAPAEKTAGKETAAAKKEAASVSRKKAAASVKPKVKAKKKAVAKAKKRVPAKHEPMMEPMEPAAIETSSQESAGMEQQPETAAAAQE